MGFPNWGEGGVDLGKIPTFSRFFVADVPNWKKYQSSCLELKVGYRCREVVDCWQEWFWNEERRRGDEKRRMRRRRGKDRRRLWSRLRKAAPHPSEQWVLKMILDVANNGKQWKAWLIHKDCKQSSLLLCQTVPQTPCEPSVSGNLISICKVSRRLFQACESARLACLKKNTFVVGSSTSIWSRRGPSDSCSFCVKFKRHNIWTFENILNNISYNHIRICLMFFSSNSRAFSAAAFLWLSTLKSDFCDHNPYSFRKRGREGRNIW